MPDSTDDREGRRAIAQAVDRAGRTRDLLARHGIDCPTVTGAGTSSFEFEAASEAPRPF